MDPRQFAFNFFIGKGWTPEQAAGIVGNLAHESFNVKNKVQLDPTVLGDHGKAFGIAQWRGDRQTNLMKWAAANQVDYKTRWAQLAFVDHELRTTEKRAGDILKAARTVPEATAAVVKHYERAGTPHLDMRLARAMDVFGAGPITTGTAVAQGASNAGMEAAGGPKVPMPSPIAPSPVSVAAKAPSQPQGLFSTAMNALSAPAPVGQDNTPDIFSTPPTEEAAKDGNLPGAASTEAPMQPLSPIQPLQPMQAAAPAAPKVKSARGPFQTAAATLKHAPLQGGGVKIRK